MSTLASHTKASNAPFVHICHTGAAKSANRRARLPIKEPDDRTRLRDAGSVTLTTVVPVMLPSHFVHFFEPHAPDLGSPLSWTSCRSSRRTARAVAFIAEKRPRYGNKRANRQPARRQPEAILHTAWRSADWACDRNGDRFRVIYPGIPGGTSGPDFKDAILEASDGRKIRGDAEIHVRIRDWYTHGHHADTAYNGVAFHVAAQATSNVEARTAAGAILPLLLLNPRSAAALEPSQANPGAHWCARSVVGGGGRQAFPGAKQRA